MQDYQALLNEAKAVLQRNTITVTVDGKPYERVIPSGDYYVHQWLWDSAGIAMGLVHLNEEAAYNELVSLVAGLLVIAYPGLAFFTLVTILAVGLIFLGSRDIVLGAMGSFPDGYALLTSSSEYWRLFFP